MQTTETQVRIANGTYRNINVNDVVFPLVKDYKEGKTGKVRLVLEKSELTETLSGAGLSPGRNIIVKKSDGKTYDIETEESTLSLDSDLAAKITELEELMYEQAKNLDFESAASTRDEISGLKEHLLHQ